VVFAAIVVLIGYALWKRRRGRIERATEMQSGSVDARARANAPRDASEEQPASG
jgi:hypothetical protein